tara:strand:- start:37 stop:717 length:681 start_codon:yes stop_codon:yes gene_type:complete
MIKYIDKLKKKINYILFKKINSKKIFFNIPLKTNKINNFLELKNIFDRSNFLWSGNWDDKKLNLANYRKYSPSYNSIFQIYHEQISYKQCEEYNNKVRLINDGKKSGRGQTLKELDDYFISLDNLKESLKNFGYKSQTELNNTSKKNDEIGVVIGKNWDVIKLQDKFGGTHRFALCKILDIKEIIVSVKAMHSSLFTKKELKKILGEDNDDEVKLYLKKKLLENID